MKFRDLRNCRYVAEGDVVECLYPKHGRLNILRKICGEVVGMGIGPGGRYITVKGEGGVIRSLSENKIIRLRKLNLA